MRKILVIDDESEVLDIMREVLEAENFEVHTAANGQIALDKLKEEAWYHLILCDLTMPVADGFEVLRNLLLDYPQIATVVVSAHSQSDKIIEALKSGAVDYLIKPLNYQEMIDKVYVLAELGESRHRIYREAHEARGVRREALFRLKNTGSGT